MFEQTEVQTETEAAAQLQTLDIKNILCSPVYHRLIYAVVKPLKSELLIRDVFFLIYMTALKRTITEGGKKETRKQGNMKKRAKRLIRDVICPIYV